MRCEESILRVFVFFVRCCVAMPSTTVAESAAIGPRPSVFETLVFQGCGLPQCCCRANCTNEPLGPWQGN